LKLKTKTPFSSGTAIIHSINAIIPTTIIKHHEKSEPFSSCLTRLSPFVHFLVLPHLNLSQLSSWLPHFVLIHPFYHSPI
jgi:hypothetical protein